MKKENLLYAHCGATGSAWVGSDYSKFAEIVGKTRSILIHEKRFRKDFSWAHVAKRSELILKELNYEDDFVVFSLQEVAGKMLLNNSWRGTWQECQERFMQSKWFAIIHHSWFDSLEKGVKTQPVHGTEERY